MKWLLATLFLAASGVEPVAAARDGDTLVMASGEVVRLENVDAPELRGACAAEIARARQARDFVVAAVGSGVVLRRRITRDGRLRPDRHARTVALVALPDGRDLGALLIAAGLARPWTGRREPWCYQAGGL